MARQTSIVIGAGIGGLSTAIRLQSAGHQVIVIEKNTLPGGKMSEIRQDGFRWDTGPSVITMRHVFEDLFTAAGKKLDDYLTFLPVEPLTRYFYADGTRLDASSDLTRMAEQISQFDERDVEGYLAYLAYAARIHRITGPVFIYDQPPRLSSFAKVPLQDWLKADPLRTMQGAIKHFVKSPQLRQLLGRFATYVGGSPYLAPATLNVIAHVELTGGVWYPQGGIYKIAEALSQVASELGVEFRYGTAVQQIHTEQGRVKAVQLANGETLISSTIIANADVTTSLNDLLEPGQIPPAKLQRLSNYEASCSGFILMLGVEGQYEALAHHNIFFSADYEAEFKTIFKDHLPADDPTVYVAITSKTDANHAPEGYENWFILVNAPALSDRYDWQTRASSYRELVLQKLADRGFDIRDRIRSEQMLTPQDLEQMTGAWRGALYGPSPNKKFTAFLRPHNRSADVKGLYFVGGTTHPGGGVPMVVLSGRVAAQMVLDDANSS